MQDRLESLRQAARRAARRWRPVLHHGDPRPGFSRLGWLRQKRLELAALLIGLGRAGTWRAALLLMLALLLVHLLRGYWTLDGPAWQLAQGLLALAVLPAVARARQAILRLLLARMARRAGGQRHGVL
jgi:hypothetical protein